VRSHRSTPAEPAPKPPRHMRSTRSSRRPADRNRSRELLNPYPLTIVAGLSRRRRRMPLRGGMIWLATVRSAQRGRASNECDSRHTFRPGPRGSMNRVAVGRRLVSVLALADRVGLSSLAAANLSAPSDRRAHKQVHDVAYIADPATRGNPMRSHPPTRGGTASTVATSGNAPKIASNPATPSTNTVTKVRTKPL
jgi:hypothetical protein